MKARAFSLMAERLKRNQSQEDIAKILGVHTATISRWENGKTRMPVAYVRLLRLSWETKLKK